jgi:Stress responsive A/B Barrel Domain
MVSNKSVKDGKPYIKSVYAGKTFSDQRAQGYTVAVVSEFASLADFTYYDTQCEAHNRLKAVAKTLHQGNMMVYFESYF